MTPREEARKRGKPFVRLVIDGRTADPPRRALTWEGWVDERQEEAARDLLQKLLDEWCGEGGGEISGEGAA